MCGGAIISEVVPPASRSSRRLTADLLWGSGAASLIKKRNSFSSYYWNPLRSKPIVHFDDDFEADFQDFEDYSDDEEELDLKNPFAFSTPMNLGVKGNLHYLFSQSLIMLFSYLIYIYIFWILTCLSATSRMLVDLEFVNNLSL